MKVITAVVNNPDFIKIQQFTLKKYMKSPQEFIVFNDAKKFPDFTNHNDTKVFSQIEKICKELNIQCINIPNDHHKKVNQASRCADSMNFILKYQLTNVPDSYLCIDSDMFLIDNFHESEFENYHAAVVMQHREVQSKPIQYFWNGIYYMNFCKIEHKDKLDWSLFPGVDVGGKMQQWLSVYDPSKIQSMPHFSSGDWGPQTLGNLHMISNQLRDFLQEDDRNQSRERFFSELYIQKFLHYRAGGNWMMQGKDLHRKLTNKIMNALI